MHPVPTDDKAPRTRAFAAVLQPVPASRCADCYDLRHPSIPRICNSATSTRFPRTSTLHGVHAQTSLVRPACNCRPRCPSRDVVSLGFPGALPDAVEASHPGRKSHDPWNVFGMGSPATPPPSCPCHPFKRGLGTVTPRHSSFQLLRCKYEAHRPHLLQNHKLAATPRLTIAFVVPRSRRLLPAVGGRSRRHSVVCASWCCAPWQREQTHTPVPLFALRPTTRLDPPRTPSHLPFKLTRRLRSPLVPRYVCPFAAFLRAKRTALLNFRERRGNVFVIKDT